MAKIFPGRYSAQIEGPFVIFLIGMRINNLLAFNKWVPVAKAMGPMVEELYANKEMGFLHAESFFSWRNAMLVQYWRSFEHLHAYAHARDAKHLPAWAAFNRSVGKDGTVGIWHETYQVAASRYESIYVNMPRFGLAAGADYIPIVGRTETAKARMGAAQGEVNPTYNGSS